MSEHTPGPWHTERENAEDGGPAMWRVFGSDDAYEATICELWSGEHDNRANARLIAQAPAMLAQLMEAEDIIKESQAAICSLVCDGEHHIKDCDGLRAWLETNAKVLAKVGGRDD